MCLKFSAVIHPVASGIRAIAAQISIDRGLEADGLVFRQADFFVQQLQQFTQGRGVGEVGGEFHRQKSEKYFMVVLQGNESSANRLMLNSSVFASLARTP